MLLRQNIENLKQKLDPSKYIAEFVYGEKADKNLLEEAVPLGNINYYICI